MSNEERPIETQTDTPVMRKRIGNITYQVKFHPSKRSSETARDKLKKLIIRHYKADFEKSS
ncbi:transposon-encoded TnpW family protein [Bengtsoniella intestinalis]|uniref:transposon-encoded TnpW family protein n=1 Tax=Bengtsoniella intestinalis TaxID=3073143 RepID=UPI00391F15D5